MVFYLFLRLVVGLELFSLPFPLARLEVRTCGFCEESKIFLITKSKISFVIKLLLPWALEAASDSDVLPPASDVLFLGASDVLPLRTSAEVLSLPLGA